MTDVEKLGDEVHCSCYGCAIERQRAGVVTPDRSGEPCAPPDACSTHGRCWTHSEWVDEARCLPLGACAAGLRCAEHAGRESGR